MYKTMAEEEGVCASQVMLLTGTNESGLEHPNWRENLKLALYLQDAVSKAHPTLMRPVEVVLNAITSSFPQVLFFWRWAAAATPFRKPWPECDCLGMPPGPHLQSSLNKLQETCQQSVHKEALT